MKRSPLFLLIGSYIVISAVAASTLSDINCANLTTSQGFSITDNVGSSFGTSVRVVGDINQDGFDDIAIGATNDASGFGAVYVLFGGSNGFGNIDLTISSLSATKRGFRITGATSGSKFGASIAKAGDLNGDGYDDIVIGAPGFSSSAGAIYVILGKKFEFTDIDLRITDLSTSGQGFIVVGKAASSFGASTNSAGDLNNDGVDDIVIGAISYSSYTGSAYVLFGNKIGLSDVDLSVTSLSTSRKGFKITGVASNNFFGFSVASAGDLNSDGINDIIIGAFAASSNGAAYVLFGKKGPFADINLATTDLFATQQGFKIIGEESGSHFGSSVSTAGDINNDGIVDLVIGADMTFSNSGTIYIVFGKKIRFTDIDLSFTDLSASKQGFKVVGISGSQLGSSVDNAGDVNGDGISDIITGAKSFSSSAGAAYIIFGKNTPFADIDLSKINLSASQQGFNITGTAANSNLGLSVSRAGDVNKDGIRGIIIGAPGDASSIGSAYIVFSVRDETSDNSSGNLFQYVTL